MFGNPLLLGDDGYQISRSVRFRSSATASFTRTPATSGNRQKFTWSGWVKRGILTTGPQLFTAGTGTSDRTCLTILSNGTIELLHAAASVNVMRYTSVPVYRDPSAWYHIVFAVDTTQAVAADRVKLYVNNVLQSLTTVTAVPLNTQTYVNHTVSHALGKEPTISSNLFDGYMADVYLIDGQQLDPSYFGQTDSATSVWSPKKYGGTYGTCGFYLPFRQTASATGFNAVTYTGTGAAMNVEGVGFQPDLIWLKSRTSAVDHYLTDSVRGAGKGLGSNSTAAEYTSSAGTDVTGFTSDGFSVGPVGGWNSSNANNANIVAWCWKKSAETGLDIVTYTGNGTTQNIAHNLSVKPAMVITKGRNTTAAENWNVWHKSLAAENYFLRLNGTDSVFTTFSNRFTAFSSTVMTVGNNSEVNENGKNYVSYVFSEIAGFSSFGSYTGNGSTTGPTITTGFRPRFVMIKRTDGIGDWEMYDTSRDTYNSANKEIWANSSNAERTVIPIDILANGFQPRDTSTNTNASGGTYIYAAFADTIDTAFYRDMSGNGNHWNVNNINGNVTTGATADLMLDVPTMWADGGNGRGNYCTLNPLDVVSSGYTLSAGNLNYTSATAGSTTITGTIGVTSGKWYFEATAGGIPTNTYLGVSTLSRSDRLMYMATGSKFSNAGTVAYGASYTTNDVIGVALDMDSGTLTFYKNNTPQGTAFTGISGEYFPFFIVNNTVSTAWSFNFGQRPFTYTPPSGFKALNTGNLPDPTIKNGNQYFDATTYTGNGTNAPNALTVTNSGSMQPDMVWIKRRDILVTHVLQDSVRGLSTFLSTESTSADQATSGRDVSSLNSNGFTVSYNNARDNAAGGSYVAWQWKEGATQGFDIVTYTGTGVNRTVAHNLGVAPSMIIIKNRSSAANWPVYHSSIGATNAVYLNITNASAATATAWNNTAPSSSVFSLGTSTLLNGNGDSYVAYLFAEVAGFSKFGSYTGNGSTDGPFVFLGFRPRFVLIKRTDAAGNSWYMRDSARDPYNVGTQNLYSDLSNAEATEVGIDFTSNGFKIRGTSTGFNASGATYIYAAFAENPFKYSLAR